MSRRVLGKQARALAFLMMALVALSGALGAGLLAPAGTAEGAVAGSLTSLDSGYFHTLLVTTSGTLWAWGENSRGQLGTGDKTFRPSPAQVGTDANWKCVAASWYHSLGVRTDGTLWAWGDNGSGQLGLGHRTSKSAPTQVGADTNWVAVAAGQYHSLGLRSDGTLWAWGSDDEGQLGTAGGNSPVQVGDAADWVGIAAGDRHSLGVRADGTLWAWGWNEAYQLGLGDMTRRTTPAQVGTDADWLSVGADFRYSMAVRNDGTLWGWGWNTQAQLGVGDVDPRPTPARVGEAANWTGVYPGRVHCQGIQSDGTLWGWGTNYDGELGLGDVMQRLMPARVGSSAWVVASCGDAFSAGVRADGTVWGWGRGEVGQLGTGNLAREVRPTQCDMPGMDWPPTVNTAAPSRILATMVTLNGYLYSLGTGSASAQVSFEWGESTAYGQATAPQPMTATGPYTAGLSGLEPLKSYHYRARVDGGNGASYGGDMSFKTTSAAATPPDVSTVDASSISGSTARLNGKLEKRGTAVSVIVSFEYGTEPGVYTWRTGDDALSQEGAFYADVSGLASGTTYYFRARGSGDGEDQAGELSFATTGTPTRPPQVETAQADHMTTGSARLNGRLTSLGTAVNVTVLFEWGEEPDIYSAETTAAGKTASGAFYCDVAGLFAGRTYYFRATAVGHGAGYGAEQQFTVPAVVPEPAAISPDAAVLGQSATVTVTGDAFTGCIGLDLGPGITVDNFTVVSASKITARITVSPDISLGPRNVTVSTGSGSYVLPGGFAVKGRSSGGLPLLVWVGIAAGALAAGGGAFFLAARRRRRPAAR